METYNKIKVLEALSEKEMIKSQLLKNIDLLKGKNLQEYLDKLKDDENLKRSLKTLHDKKIEKLKCFNIDLYKQDGQNDRCLLYIGKNKNI
jgi:hypothetical protein